MPFTKQGDFTNKVTDLPDVPSPAYTATQIKDAIQQPSEDLKKTFNNLVDDLNADGWVDEGKLAPKSVTREKVAPGSIGTNEIDPDIMNQPTSAIGVQAKFDTIDSQLADKAEKTDVDNSLSLKADKTYVDTSINPKADKSYVDTQISNIGNASPKGTYATLADLQNAFPTGTTGIYVVAADGKWYYWNGSAWTAGGTYQSTGIGDGIITRQMVSKTAKRTMDLLNNRNIFKNPNFNDHSSWGYITTDFVIDEINATHLSNSAKVPVDAVNLPYIYQDIPVSEFIDGNYTLSFLLKTDVDTNSNVNIGVTGYPTTANSGGTALYSLSNQKAWTIEGGEWQRNTFTFDLSGVSAYDHIRVFIQTRNPSRNYYFAEMYLGLTNEVDNDFSYIYKKITGNKLLGKSLYIDGDSISYGAGFVGGYGKILQSDYGAVVTNKAVSGGTLASGTTYSDGTPRHYVCDSVASNVTIDYDYAIFSGGYNDYGNNVPLGTLSSGDYWGDSALDKTTVIGALETMFRYMANNHPKTKLYYLMTHNINRTATVKNTLGLSMQDYYNAIKSVCDRYAIRMMDMFGESRFVTYFTSMKTYTIDDDGDGQPDGTHPTEDGYRTFYIPVIEKVIGL